jgi:hypothetical protein
VGYPFFYGIGWLISSSSVFTISLTLSTKFENCENKTRGCSPKTNYILFTIKVPQM